MTESEKTIEFGGESDLESVSLSVSCDSRPVSPSVDPSVSSNALEYDSDRSNIELPEEDDIESTADPDYQEDNRPKKKKRKNRCSGFIRDQNEGSDSEEMEDEEINRKKKKKDDRYGGFIITEAEVDDESHDSDDWEEVNHDLGIVSEAEEAEGEKGPTAPEIEGRHRMKSLWDTKHEEELERYLRQRYGNIDDTDAQFGAGNSEKTADIEQQALLPGTRDPNLWLIKCRHGEERITTLHLMRKFITYEKSDDPLLIKSIVLPEGARGYIYIEAYKQTHVKAAINKVGSLRSGSAKQKMVPINEMSDVLRVRRAVVPLQVNQWVRIKRGVHKDDLARVDFIDVPQNLVTVKLIPRIDYTRLRGALTNFRKKAPPKKHRPPTKPFDPEAIRAIGGDVATDGDHMSFEGNRYCRKGFLYKVFAMNNISMYGIKPTLIELEKFEDNLVSADIGMADGTIDTLNSNKALALGDNVEVVAGDLQGLWARISALDGDMVTVVPQHEQLKDSLLFKASDLCKVFRVGDHVKVLSGNYEGETGLIVSVQSNRVILLSDITFQEIEKLPSDIQICTDMSSGVDSSGHFQFGDLVQLDPSNVGVIVRMEREVFHVLGMNGKKFLCKPAALQKRVVNNFTLTMDKNHSTVSRKDIVKVCDGQYAGRVGEVRHLYRFYLFVHSVFELEHGGLFVVKSNHVVLAGDQKVTSSKNYIDSPFMSPQTIASPRPLQSSVSSGSRLVKRDLDRKIVGRTIKITGGPYKGFVGIVVDATSSTVRVELHTNCLIITVDRARVSVVAQEGQNKYKDLIASDEYADGSSVKDTKGSKGWQTPMYGAGGSRTPSYAPMTPTHDGGLNCSAWDPLESNTPGSNSDSGGCRDESGNIITPQSCYTPSPRTSTGRSEAEPRPPKAPDDYRNNFLHSSESGPALYSPTAMSQSSAMIGSMYKEYDSSNYVMPIHSGNMSYISTPSPPVPYCTTPPPIAPDWMYNYKYYNPYGVPFARPADGWQTANLGVRIVVNFPDQTLAGRAGIIKSSPVDEEHCHVFLLDDQSMVTVQCRALQPIPPAIGDRLMVILGEDYKSTGKLLCCDGPDGIVEFGINIVKMLPMYFLCKMYEY